MMRLLNAGRVTCGLWSVLMIHAFVALYESSAKTVAGDSINVTQISKGITHTEYTLSGPYTLDVLTIDLRAADCRLVTFRPDSLTKTTSQARMNGGDERKVVAAVNADFFSFSTHWPLGNQVRNGMIVHGSSSSRRSHVVFGENGRPLFTPMSFEGSLVASDGSVIRIHEVNDRRDSGTVVLYNVYRGKRIPIDSTDDELPLRLVGDHWVTNDTMRFIAGKIRKARSAEILGTDGAIGFGKEGGSGLAKVRPGDTVSVVIVFPQIEGPISEVVAGAGRILWNGTAAADSFRQSEGLNQAFVKARHPRTFLAIDKDTTRFFLCTVDGRQPTSIGMSFEEMARFLLTIGGWNAINLDGGGSTTMVVDGRIVNSPSDKTGERAVANTLQVIQRE